MEQPIGMSIVEATLEVLPSVMVAPKTQTTVDYVDLCIVDVNANTSYYVRTIVSEVLAKTCMSKMYNCGFRAQYLGR